MTTKKIHPIIILLFLLFLAGSAFAQQPNPSNPDPSHPDPLVLTEFSRYEVHFGAGIQEGLFIGLKDVIYPLVLGVDLGYDVFASDKFVGFNSTIGYFFDGTRFYPSFSYGYKMQKFFSVENLKRQDFIGLNLGWDLRHREGLTYAFIAGAGLELSSTRPDTYSVWVMKTGFYVNLQATIGWGFR